MTTPSHCRNTLSKWSGHIRTGCWVQEKITDRRFFACGHSEFSWARRSISCLLLEDITWGSSAQARGQANFQQFSIHLTEVPTWKQRDSLVGACSPPLRVIRRGVIQCILYIHRKGWQRHQP
uniref:Uncharacterized protein n=1 Tax=Spironucleus salmonicida TaxID=348837 RepID=V6LWG2_9EUKA|eukprot:EST48905.1 Hypothetical protein SS50377_10849 [Spironucleus salmonicida]